MGAKLLIKLSQLQLLVALLFFELFYLVAEQSRTLELEIGGAEFHLGSQLFN